MARHSRLRERFRRRTDEGTSLIELLIAVVIISLAVGPLLGALMEALSSSGEGRSLATLDTVLNGFAETATSAVELAHTTPGPTFDNCSGTPSYGILSLPTPRSAAPGAATTVFGTGFGSGLPVGTFHVTVGGAPATVIRKQSQKVSGTAVGNLQGMGNMQLTFKVPSGLTGTQVVSVTDGHGTTVSSTPATELDVTPAAATSAVSPVSGYTLGVKTVRYVNPATPTETAPFTDCVLNGGIQLLTLHARAPDGVSDTLNFDLRNPTDVHVPVPTPAITVAVSPSALVALPSTGSFVLTFTATVTPASSEPQPTKPVTWSVSATTGGTSTAVPCTASGPTTGPDKSSVYSCAVTLTPSSSTGRYSATATYPAVATVNGATTNVGFASVYGANGSGAITVAPTTAAHGATGKTFTFTYTAGAGGMNGGQVTIAIPTPGTTPTKAWTPPQTTDPSAPGYTVATIGTTPATVLVSGKTIEVTGVTLAQGQTLTVVYGTGGGAAGVTAPTTPGTYSFTTDQASVPRGTPTALTPAPKVKVT